MQSKTPQFDRLLDEVLENLVPHTRTCKWTGEHPHCEGDFEITAEDILFLKMLRVPAPNFCPTCRRMRRMVYMGLSQLFKRKCDVPEHDENLISIFSDKCPFPVYDYKYFIGDEFDPFSFGKEYEQGADPMELLWNMRKVFPMPSFLNRDPSSINSEYSNGGRNTKNGYYVFGCYGSEDIWYSYMAGESKSVMDSRYVRKVDHVYRGLHSQNIYKSSFVYFSKDCTDSMFLFDCRNCDSCFGCVGLRGARYHVYNKQLSKEEYQDFIKNLYPLKRSSLKDYEDKFWSLVKSLPMNGPRNIAVENISGVMNNNVKNAYDITDSEDSEHIRHADGGLSHKDSMDFLFSGGHSSFLYGTTNIGSQSSNVKFSVSSKFCTNSEFIFNSKNLNNCFMCFGLQSKSYCVLNKQYTPEEYFILVDDIKSEMIKKGQYGDGLEMNFSAQSYNFSLGQASFPLSDKEIVRLGGYVATEPESSSGNMKVLSSEEIPETIDEVSDDILNYALTCEETGRSFRIVESELQFLRKMKLPLPSINPTLRMLKLVMFSPMCKKYQTTCAKCNKDMESLLNPKDGYILYCEKCYQQEVY